MSPRPAGPSRLVASFARRDDDPLAVFARGATVGAFVGAVIAGSTLWRRLRRPGAGLPPAGAAAEQPPAPPPDHPDRGQD